LIVDGAILIWESRYDSLRPPKSTDRKNQLIVTPLMFL
jgi:hypothetical protein